MTQGAMPADGTRYARAKDGALLQYETHGAGEPVVFLPGSFVGRDTFSQQRKELAGNFRQVLRDLRGHNGSEARVPPDYALDMTELDDLICVLDAEGIDRTHLVGHSTGGAIAFAFARRYPERVRRMVLLEPSLFNLPRGERQTQNRAELERIQALAEQGEAVAATRAVFTYILGPRWAVNAPPSLISQMEAAAPMAGPHLRALLAWQVTPEDVCTLAPPTLYIQGGRSLAYYVAIFERIGEVHPEAARLLVEDAGHAVYVQRPAKINAAIRDFLGSD